MDQDTVPWIPTFDAGDAMVDLTPAPSLAPPVPVTAVPENVHPASAVELSAAAPVLEPGARDENPGAVSGKAGP